MGHIKDTMITAPTLNDLAFKYRSDKGTIQFSPTTWMHCYTRLYDEIFSPRRDQKLNILDIGAVGENHGGSSMMLAEYFPNAQIYSIDLNPEVMTLESDRIKAQVVNLDNEMDTIVKLSSWNVPFDIVVEDASHQPKQQMRTLVNLHPLLANGFQYIIEDVCDNHEILHAVEGGSQLPHMSVFEWFCLRSKCTNMQVVKTNGVSKLVYLT